MEVVSESMWMSQTLIHTYTEYNFHNNTNLLPSWLKKSKGIVVKFFSGCLSKLCVRNHKPLQLVSLALNLVS